MFDCLLVGLSVCLSDQLFVVLGLSLCIYVTCSHKMSLKSENLSNEILVPLDSVEQELSNGI